jgi:hypothetical protein
VEERLRELSAKGDDLEDASKNPWPRRVLI